MWQELAQAHKGTASVTVFDVPPSRTEVYSELEVIEVSVNVHAHVELNEPSLPHGFSHFRASRRLKIPISSSNRATEFEYLQTAKVPTLVTVVRRGWTTTTFDVDITRYVTIRTNSIQRSHEVMTSVDRSGHQSNIVRQPYVRCVGKNISAV